MLESVVGVPGGIKTWKATYAIDHTRCNNSRTWKRSIMGNRKDGIEGKTLVPSRKAITADTERRSCGKAHTAIQMLMGHLSLINHRATVPSCDEAYGIEACTSKRTRNLIHDEVTNRCDALATRLTSNLYFGLHRRGRRRQPPPLLPNC